MTAANNPKLELFSEIINYGGNNYRVEYTPQHKSLYFKGTNTLKNKEALKRSLVELVKALVEQNAFQTARTQVVSPQSSLWKPFVNSLKNAELPDPLLSSTPHLRIVVDQRLVADFNFYDESPVRAAAINQFQQVTFERRANESDHAFSLRATDALLNGGKKKDREFSESMQGVHLGTVVRPNYSMGIALQGGMKKFFQRSQFESHEFFAKNSRYVQGGITSSYNRYADTVTMMRAVIAPENPAVREDSSVDYYTGRVDCLAKAKELATFMYRCDCVVNRSSLDNGSTQSFSFAVQSLLNMQGGEGKMFAREIQAYKELEEAGPIPVKISESVTVFVQFKPIAIAANQFNYMNTAEQMIPDSFSGRSAADAAQERADRALIAYAANFARENELDFSLNKQIQDASYHLTQGRSQLKPWQIILNRAFLCHLLKLPLVVHCKSSIDRTGLAGGMITAMKQWLRAKKVVPEDKGRYAIHEIANVLIDEGGNVTPTGTCEPFKELFACAVTKSLKTTEFSRGYSGFKWERGIGQNPALADLMPKRLLNTQKTSVSALKELVPFVSTAMAIAAFALGNFFLLIGPAALILLSTAMLATKQIKLSNASSATIVLNATLTLYSVIYSCLTQAILLAIQGSVFSALPWFLPLALLLIAGFALALKQKSLSPLPALLLLPFKFIKGYYLADVLRPLEEVQLKEESGLLEPEGAGGGA